MTTFVSVRARDHVLAPARTSGIRGDAVSMLTVYFVLLFAIPSGLTITPLASLGRPSMIWGLVLLLWWFLDRIQRTHAPAAQRAQPVTYAVFALLAVLVVSYGAALLRGQPADQVSPATNSMVNLISLCGVTLVAVDGITSLERFRALVQRLVLAGALIAALGLAQFATGQSFVDAISIPGMSNTGGGVQGRAEFVRAAGTAVHPLEYAMVLAATLPLAIALALDHTISTHRRFASWLAVAVIAAAAALSVSRSALLGVGVGAIFIIPIIPKRLRGLFVVAGAALVMAIGAFVPGMISTMLALFTGLSNDASAQSRAQGLSAGLQYLASSPVIGIGWGTLLPRYYIFDDQWLGLLVQLGVVGALAFAVLLAVGAWSAYSARLGPYADPIVRNYGQALIAAMASAAVLCASFDAFSFPQAAGLCFLLPGLGAALRASAPRVRRLPHSVAAPFGELPRT